ncbi:MAG: acyl carrier protein [Candidatus Staskawiczbacteria bacterium]
MDANTIQKRVIDVLARTTGVLPKAITPKTKLWAAPLNIVWHADDEVAEPIHQLKEEFIVEIDGVVIRGWKTVADVIAYIESVPHQPAN